MSEEIKAVGVSATVSEILTNPYEVVPPEKLLTLLQEWREKVTEDISDYNNKKDKVYVVYKRQKDLYDKWLTGPLTRMKKFDKVITERKKVLMDVDKEINKLKETLNTKIDA